MEPIAVTPGVTILLCVLTASASVAVTVLVSVRRHAASRRQAQTERRRLREQLRHEQLKNESFQRYALFRMDTHDQVLEIDTRRTPELGHGGSYPALDATLRPVHAEAGWHYTENGSSIGPVPQATVRELLASGEIGPDTLLWREGQEGWLPARAVPGFQDVVAS
jgi:hypothetical protein